jgi:hypothetical protein
MNFSLAMDGRGDDYEDNPFSRHPEPSRGIPPWNRKLSRRDPSTALGMTKLGVH